MEFDTNSYKETLKAFKRIDISYSLPHSFIRNENDKYVDFEQYVKEKCKNKFKILNRETFHEIKKPIIIYFNHFREKCVHFTKWLDSIYNLASKYGDKIEFIAADIFDIDIIYPGRNPIKFFQQLVFSEFEKTRIFAIDKKKRIYEHKDGKLVKTILELLKYLLNDLLYYSMPLPENNNNKLVKICVYDNFDELVLKSTKNIFLIINLGKFEKCGYESHYNNVALALKGFNIDIVYMEERVNYIPFVFDIDKPPKIYFIPHNDKSNFVLYDSLIDKKLIINYLNNIMDNPEFLKRKQQEYKSQILCKKVEVPQHFEIDFKDLPEFLKQNYGRHIIVFNLSDFKNRSDAVFVVFMDFQGKCFKQHVEWFDKLYQITEEDPFHLKQFLIADFKDINAINTKWQPKDMIATAQGKPLIYAMDRIKHTYEFGRFDSIPKLFYFVENIRRLKFFYSENCINYKHLMVKKWVALDFPNCIEKTEKHIFITFYSSLDEKSNILIEFLKTIALAVKELNVIVVKFDVALNYVDLEYAQPTYPAQYLIVKNNTNINLLYQDNCMDKEKILNFIKSNISPVTQDGKRRKPN